MKHKLALPLFILLCASSSFAQRKDFELAHHARRSRHQGRSGVRQRIRRTKPACACSTTAETQWMRAWPTMFAASVAEFSHFGMGGEAPILIRTKAGKVYAIAGVGTMPKLATAKFFLEHRSRPGEILTIDPGGLKGIIPVAGILPALVPSMVEAGLVALREFGTKSFSEAIEPAIELADGMAIDEMRSGSIARSRRFFDLWPDSKKTFLPDGRVPLPGEIFRQPDLARTLRAMAAAEKKALAAGATRAAAIDAVRDYFYRGEIAHRIDAFMQANGGLLRYEDMAAFKLQPEEPVSTDYHGYKVYKPGFWSQGPAMIEALNILEGYDLRSMGCNSADYIHTVTEALKLAYADRDTYYGDPKFNNIPADMLLSKAYAAERRKQIGHKASHGFPARRHQRQAGQASHRDGHRAHQDRRCADGQRHHLRGRHR